MTTTILDEYILPILVRYIDGYHWNWTITTAYTKKRAAGAVQKGR